MCARFILIPKELLEEIIRDIESGTVHNAVNLMPDWPAVRRSAYPGTEVPVIVSEGSSLKPELMNWGFSVSWTKSIVFNTRSDTAMKPGSMWADSIRSRRCVIPTLGFFESHHTQTVIDPRTSKEHKQHYLFTMPSSPVFYLAGIYEENRFSVITTDPNDSVVPIHNRMPLVLMHNELHDWLYGDYTALFERGGIRLCAEKDV